MRLLCDEMPTGIGRWLRAAGYDTAIAASGASDDLPFSRCLLDNAPLQEAPPAVLDRLPVRARRGAGRITVCPACGRVYWPDSHIRRMRARLDRWRQAT
jgi:uncharacterized protein with PIN domain